MTKETEDRQAAAIAVILDIWDLMERVGYMDRHNERRVDLVLLYRSRALNVDPWVYDALPKFGVRTLRNWRREYRYRGQGKRGSGHFAPGSRWRKVANDLWLRYLDIPAAEIHREILRIVEWEISNWGTAEPAPSLRSVERYISGLCRLDETLPYGLLKERLAGDRTPFLPDPKMGCLFEPEGR